MNNTGTFTDKVALVTGAGSGIGEAIAMAFAREGASLALSDINKPAVDAVADQIRNLGCNVTTCKTDVSKTEDVANFVTQAVADFGHIDCAINNAGIRSNVKPLADFSEEEFDQMMAINLKGVWLCMKHEISEMLKSGGGSIVNIASGAGLLGVPNNGTYVAAKHGVVGLTRAGALDYAQSNIRINAVCPGYTRTPMSLGSLADAGLDESAAVAVTPLGRIGNPEEQANAVLYLCSEQASFILGQAIPVDGGHSVW